MGNYATLYQSVHVIVMMVAKMIGFKARRKKRFSNWNWKVDKSKRVLYSKDDSYESSTAKDDPQNHEILFMGVDDLDEISEEKKLCPRRSLGVVDLDQQWSCFLNWGKGGVWNFKLIGCS